MRRPKVAPNRLGSEIGRGLRAEHSLAKCLSMRFSIVTWIGGLMAVWAGVGPVLAGPKPGELVRSQQAVFRIEEVASGLGVPWGIAFLPDGDALFTEREGRVRWIRSGALVEQPVVGVPAVWARGQGGLLDIAVHPKFAQNRLVYLSYSVPDAKGEKAHTALWQARFEAGEFRDGRVIFQPPERVFTGSGVHFGSRIVFDRAGFLFLAVGERGDMQKSQDLQAYNGKVFRLRDDGTVPPDNPFAGRGYALPGIWSYGHRNPQGLAFHPVTGELWEAEHGPKGGDELNIVRKGANYGWPVITYGVNYNGSTISEIQAKAGMEQPQHYYVPSIAICGIAFSAGEAFPEWRGDLFAASLKFGYVERLELAGGKVTATEKLLEGAGRTRHVAFSPDGALWVLLESPGRIWRLVPVAVP